MPDEFAGELLAKLQPIDVKDGTLDKSPDSDNLLELRLLGLAGVSLESETERLRTIFSALKKIPQSETPHGSRRP